MNESTEDKLKAYRFSLQQITDSSKLIRYIDSDEVTVTKAASATSGSETITHNLGFIPGVFGYVYDGTSRYALPYVKVHLTSGIVNLHAYAVPSLTGITFTLETPSSGTLYSSELSYTFRYYLTIQTAN